MRFAMTLTVLLCSIAAGAQAAWHTVAGIPAKVSATGSFLFADTDGYLYISGQSSRTPPVGNYVYRMSMAQPGNPVEITGKGLPSGAAVDTMGQLADGTVLISCHQVDSNGKLRGFGDVYWWNGSEASSVWKTISGFNGRIDQIINMFSNDAEGYTYFSPEWTGEMWRNRAPSSKSFERVLPGLYSLTQGGGPQHPTTGGLYEYHVWDLGDGRGKMLWAGGEGELDSLPLNGDVRKNQAYGRAVDGFGGNMAGLAKGPNHVLFLLYKKTSPGLEYLHRIDIDTKAVTEPLQGFPRPEHGFPTHLMNVYNGLTQVEGKKFIFSGKDYHTGRGYPEPGPTYLLFSRDEGETWEDLTVGEDAGCTGSNLALVPAVTAKFVWVRCQGGRRIDYYGPL